MSDPQPVRPSIDELAEEYRERLRQGDSPDIEEYVRRSPELEDEIRDLFPAMELMEELKPAGDVTGAFSDEGTGPEGVTLERLGDFRILREVGRGGMGVVYEAEQESLGRRVALKVLPTGALMDANKMRRFQREAKSTAKLHHTNIVPIYGVGEHEGVHYYVMQFIQGLGLDDVLRELRLLRKARSSTKDTVADGELSDAPPLLFSQQSRDFSAADVARSLFQDGFVTQTLPGGRAGQDNSSGSQVRLSGALSGSETDSSVTLPGQSGQTALADTGHHYWHSVARIGIQVAQALEYANGQGIVHRDIKPSNLLLDTEGTVWVTDFGLAKAMADEENLTHTGDIVGTLRYMAPERFHGQSDVRGDIYSLGLTLYEMLVQRPAYDETDRNKLIHQVTHTSPPPPRKRNPSIPHDLETIILKSIEHEPERRYVSAGALADDLQRFVEDRPIGARRISPTERFWRWCKRNPALARVSGMLIVSFLIGFVLVAYMGWRANQNYLEAARQREQARLHQKEAEDNAGKYLLAAKEAKDQAKKTEDQRKIAEANAKKFEAAAQDAKLKSELAQTEKGRAEANFRKALNAVDDYLTTVSESRLLKVPGMQPLRKELLQSAQKYYESFVQDHGHDPQLKRDLALAYNRVAGITADIGTPADALVIHEKAAAIWQELRDQNPKNIPATLDLVEHHRLVAALQLRLGNLEDAADSCKLAYDLLLNVSPQKRAFLKISVLGGSTISGVKAHDSSDPRIRRAFVGVLNDYGDVRFAENNLQEALQRYYQALYIQQKSVKGEKYFSKQGELTSSDTLFNEKFYEKAYLLKLDGGSEYVVDLESKEFDTILIIRDAKGNYLESNDDGGTNLNSRLLFRPPSTDSYQIVVTTYGAGKTGKFMLNVVKREKSDMVLQERGLANQWSRLGQFFADMRMYDSALLYYNTAHNILSRMPLSGSGSADRSETEREKATIFEAIADLFARTNKLNQALLWHQQGFKIRKRLARQNPAVTDYQSDLAHSILQLAALQNHSGQDSAALKNYQEALDKYQTVNDMAPNAPVNLRAMSKFLSQLADFQMTLKDKTVKQQVSLSAAAMANYRKARSLMQALSGDWRLPASAAGMLGSPAIRPLDLVGGLAPGTPEFMADAGDFYQLALLHCVCADDAPKTGPLSQNPLYKAMDVLHRAVALGFKDIQELETNKKLDRLRSSKEFQSLLANLRARYKILVWEEDLEAAKSRAAKENKDIYVYFGGGDWASFDVAFRKRIFNHPVFVEYVSEHFVPLLLDKLNHTPQAAKNSMILGLMSKWGGTNTFPYMVLSDAQGRPYYARIGSNSLSPEDYVNDLEEKRKSRQQRDELLAQAAKTKGVEKALLLDNALRGIAGKLVKLNYQPVIDDILKADPDNISGLHGKYSGKERLGELPHVTLMKQNNWHGALRKLDLLLEKFEPDSDAAQFLYRDRAKVFVQLGELKKAAVDYARIHPSLLKESQLWLEHAFCLLQINEGEEYRKHCERMIQKFRDSPKVWDGFMFAWTCGMAAQSVADLKQPIEHGKRFLSQNADGPWYHSGLALAYYRNGQFDMALEHLRLADGKNYNWESSLNNLLFAVTYHRQGKLKEARAWLQKALPILEKDSKNKPLYQASPNALQHRDMLVTQAILSDAFSLFDGSPSENLPGYQLMKARLHAGLKQWDRAAACLTKEIETKPDDQQLLKERAFCYAHQKKFTEAAADFSRVLELYPKNRAYHRNIFCEEFAQWTELVEMIAQSPPKGMPGWQVLRGRGTYLARLNQWQASLKEYERFNHLTGDFNVRLEMGCLLLLNGKIEEYRKLSRDTFAIHKIHTSEYAHRQLAWLTTVAPDGIDDPQLSIDLAERAVAKQKNNASFEHVLGLTYYRAGHYQRAIDHLSRQKPAGWHQYDWLVMALANYRLGNYSEAERLLDQADGLFDLMVAGFPKQRVRSPAHIWLPSQVLRREADSLRASAEKAIALRNEGKALKEKGEFEKAIVKLEESLKLGPAPNSVAKSLLEECRQAATMEIKAKAILKGDIEPKDVSDLISLAAFCREYKKWHAAEARVYAKIMELDPKRAKNPNSDIRIAAAGAAVLAGTGQGHDAASLNDKERANWRQKALQWLRDDVALYKKSLSGASPARIVSIVTNGNQPGWLKEPDLSAVRDEKQIAKLPNKEQADWHKFWAEAKQALKHVRNSFKETTRKGELSPAKTQTHQIAMQAGKTYLIDMTSNQFDTYLRLLDKDGKQLAYDDDGGGGLNSRMVYTPPKNGSYQIVAGSFMGSGSGSYELTIREFNAKPKDE